MLSKRRKGAIFLVLSIFSFVFYRLPDYIENFIPKFEWWKNVLNKVVMEWQWWWSYVLLFASFFFLAWGIRLLSLRAQNGIPDPDCTLPQLIRGLTRLAEDKYLGFEVPVATNIGFILESYEPWIEKLCEGKIPVWGRETKYDNPEALLPPPGQIRCSPFIVQIPKDFWKHNRINLSGQWLTDVVQTGKTNPNYTQIEFSKEQALKEVENILPDNPQELFGQYLPDG